MFDSRDITALSPADVARLGPVRSFQTSVFPRGIFVACVLTFRRGIVGELAHWLRVKL